MSKGRKGKGKVKSPEDHGELTPGADWNVPLPAKIPAPTFWPAGLAFGITLLLWGIVTSLVIVAFGFAAIVVALVGWIGDIRHEAKAH